MPIHNPQPDSLSFISIYEGKCISNADPAKRGCIQVSLPGIYENGSPWVPPIGAVGGGQQNLGFFFPPRVGANVIILFKGGDTDHPRYLAGIWGETEGESDIPSFAQFDPQDDTTELTDDERALVNGIETEKWQIILDNREGKHSLIIREKFSAKLSDSDKNIRNEIEIDGASGGIVINAVAGMSITCKGSLSIDAMNLRINGRVVDGTTKRPI